MLESLRTVVAGAEKLNTDVRESFQLKFNKTILEGYGATETAPVASVNLPDALDNNHWKVQFGSKLGTVGMPLPGTSCRVVDPNTEQELPTGEAGMIMIGGPQVMQGYLNNPEKTANVIREIDGKRWYITGDKGFVDQDSFLTIVDRYSRFAKVDGEMIGLGQVEQQLQDALKDFPSHTEATQELLATTVPDQRSGEAIVLLSTTPLQFSDLKQALITNGCNPLSIPSHCYQVEAIPKLGSGKTDFNQAKALAKSLVLEED